uniref:Uncharacterized protein LOC116958484 isoform X2 n=1 Tax=Petromyzon marinus TaxID=7757 RepID=A0AAJ7UII2_PETMA|nr:uncharacterized protein LOC116958484 isoform X2 [Petromyzon marinus]
MLQLQGQILLLQSKWTPCTKSIFTKPRTNCIEGQDTCTSNLQQQVARTLTLRRASDTETPGRGKANKASSRREWRSASRTNWSQGQDTPTSNLQQQCARTITPNFRPRRLCSRLV